MMKIDTHTWFDRRKLIRNTNPRGVRSCNDALHSMDRRMLAPARRIFSKSPGATVLSGLYPKESEEKRLLDAMLLAVPR